MSNLFNLPFPFSSNPQALKNLLQHRKNISLNSSEDRWSEKAIKGLIKRLSKSSMIDDLQTALDSQNVQTRCVTIPRSVTRVRTSVHQRGSFSDAQTKLVEPNPSQTIRKAFNDVTPVVAFCRIWRWPDLNTHLELRPNEACTFAFQHEKDQICVNPYHYERVVAPCKHK
jgi:mothers against decapentaplegic homolog 3